MYTVHSFFICHFIKANTPDYLKLKNQLYWIDTIKNQLKKNEFDI